MLPSLKFGRWFLALGVAVVLGLAMPALAAERDLQIDVSRGKLLNLARPAGSVFVADPNIAGVQVPSDRQIFVFGKKPGQTTLFVLGEDGKQIASMTITVTTPVAGLQAAANSATQGTVKVSVGAGATALSGTVPTPETGAAVTGAVSANLPKEGVLVNAAKVSTSAQVNLKVRIAEVDRTIMKSLGINLNEAIKAGSFSFGPVIGRQTFTTTAPTLFLPSPAAGSPGSFLLTGNTGTFGTQTVIDALADEGLVTMLAEPTLTALSGEPASFLAGGEFPVPTPQPGSGGGQPTISVTFKQFGVALNFVPTVIASNRISLHVRPEVSQLTTSPGAGAVNISGFTIPALTVRRAETTIELGSGESFAIAGLIQNNSDTDVTRYPGLGDLPILGPLFRSNSFTRNETELVVIVTPYISEPVADPTALRTPLDGLAPANDIDRILRARVAARTVATVSGAGSTPAPADTPRLAGDAGFDIE